MAIFVTIYSICKKYKAQDIEYVHKMETISGARAHKPAAMFFGISAVLRDVLRRAARKPAGRCCDPRGNYVNLLLFVSYRIPAGFFLSNVIE